MTAKVSLASTADSYSFLLPVLGFANRADADRYIEQATAGAEHFAFGDSFEPLHLSSRSYVAPFGARHDDWETNRVFEGPIMSKPGWFKLRDKGTAKTPGSYNLVLMVEGVRSYFRHVQHRAKIAPYMYRLAEGLRDCYAVWSGFDGRDLIPVMSTGGSDKEQPGQRVFAARSARGVLYARAANYGSNGELTGYTLRAALVEFSVLDRDPARDDMLRVTVMRQIAHSYKADEKPEVSRDHLDDAWKKLIDRAESGFNRWCREVPEDVEAWRQMFVEQSAKARAERELQLSSRRSESYRSQVEGLDWQAALADVKEAWQLEVVIDVHCGTKFDDSQHRCDSNGHRVGVMLSRVDDAERRDALRKMVSEFVAPRDKLWSYTGD
jgi:hypothetical protein